MIPNIRRPANPLNPRVERVHKSANDTPVGMSGLPGSANALVVPVEAYTESLWIGTWVEWRLASWSGLVDHNGLVVRVTLCLLRLSWFWRERVFGHFSGPLRGLIQA